MFDVEPKRESKAVHMGTLRRGERILFLLEQNALNARKAGRLLRGLMASYESATGDVQEIIALERFGDEITDQTAIALQKGGTSGPMEARDLAALSDALDGIVDGIGSVTVSMHTYGLGAPTVYAQTMAETIGQSAADLQRCVGLLHAKPSRHTDILALAAAVKARAAGMERANGGLLAPHFVDGQGAEVALKWRDVYADLRRALAETRVAAMVLEGALMPRRRGLLRSLPGLRPYRAQYRAEGAQRRHVGKDDHRNE